jgi:hypothetical protein
LSEIGWGTAEARVKSGEDGRFEFPAVRAGDWRITAETKRSAAKWMGFTTLTMPRHDVENAVVHIAPPFTLDGVVEGMSHNEGARGSVSLLPVAGPYEQESNATQQPDGTLHFENVYPGRYRIALWTNVPGRYLKSILLGTEDVTGRAVDLAPNSPPLRVICKSNAARAVGQVENGAGVKVIFIEAQESNSVPGQSLRVAVCDREGRFAIEGLRPTTYYAFAIAIGNVESGAMTEIVFTRGLSRLAQTVQLAEGETATVNLKIIPWPE